MSENTKALLPEKGTIERASGVMQVNRSWSGFLHGLPVRESESIQLGPGSATGYRSRRFHGRELIILDYKTDPKQAIQVATERDWAVLLMSTNPRSNMVINGRAVRPFDLFLSTGPDGYMTTGTERRHIVVVIRKSRLIATCAALAGVDMEDISLADLVLAREQGSGQRLYRGLVDVMGQFCGNPPSEVQCRVPRALENDLESMLATELVQNALRVPEVNYFRVDALRVVRAAIAASKALRRPSLAALCAATGVSQRWLHKCFTDVLGVSPYRYIRLARLAQAREILLAGEPTPSFVKRVSLSAGYRLSGRFAKEYRSLYGENPSDTLRRSHGV
jgi:AraC-like DNA-binding protein